MRVLELFCGENHSIGKVAHTLGWEVISVDINRKANPDLLLDILDFDETKYAPTYFQFIWASPPCESYSTARTTAKEDRSVAMQRADKLVAKTRQIIRYFECHWAFENPGFSLIWTREVSEGLKEKSCMTSYCCWGTPYRKHTRIANSFELSLPRCPGAGLCPSMIGSRHAEAAQQGGGGVTNKYHTRAQLHSIPSGLVMEIFNQLHSNSPSLRYFGSR